MTITIASDKKATTITIACNGNCGQKLTEIIDNERHVDLDWLVAQLLAENEWLRWKEGDWDLCPDCQKGIDFLRRK